MKNYRAKSCHTLTVEMAVMPLKTTTAITSTRNTIQKLSHQHVIQHGSAFLPRTTENNCREQNNVEYM